MEMHRYVRRDASVEMDMTPMIDIVFLLIIFFMVVTELTNLENPEVILPIADQARVEDPQPGSRSITVNIVLENLATGEGAIKIGGTTLSKDELLEFLKEEAAAYDRWSPNPTDSSRKDSLLELLIRGDEGVNSGYIHEVYESCRSAKLFKVRLAAHNQRLEPAYGGDR